MLLEMLSGDSLHFVVYTYNGVRMEGHLKLPNLLPKQAK